MNLNPIYEATAWDHGFAPMDLAARLVRDLNNPMPCRRCDDAPDSIRTCAACLAEIAMRDDDESHANECAMHEARWSALADDEWGDL